MEPIGTLNFNLPDIGPLKPPRPRVPRINQLPDGWSEDFNPEKCPVCFGVGHVSHEGRLMDCPDCRVSERHRLARLSAMLDECRASLTRQFGETPASFDTFEWKDDQHKAMIGAALIFAQEPLGWLTIHGMGLGRRLTPDRHLGAGEWHTGAGKTHLAVAICKRLLDYNIPAYYVRAPELYRWLGAVERTDNDPDYAERLKWIKNLPVLIIDDHNQEHQSDFVWQTRAEILIGRYTSWQQGGPLGATVILSNDRPAGWDDPSIASRCYQAGKVVVASSNDYRVQHGH